MHFLFESHNASNSCVNIMINKPHKFQSLKADWLKETSNCFVVVQVWVISPCYLRLFKSFFYFLSAFLKYCVFFPAFWLLRSPA